MIIQQQNTNKDNAKQQKIEEEMSVNELQLIQDQNSGSVYRGRKETDQVINQYEKQLIDKNAKHKIKHIILTISSLITIILILQIHQEFSSLFQPQNKQAQTKINQTKQLNENHEQKSNNLNHYQKYKIRQRFREHTPEKISPKTDLYQFTTSIQNVLNYNHKNLTFQQNLSIRLMQVNHNININGQFQFDHFKYYPSGEQKFKSLSTTIQQEYQYYDEKYQISSYKKSQLRFCIFIPTYNPSQKNRIYLRNLDSVFQQQYDNYHVVIVNDASTDGTKEYLAKYMQVNRIPIDKFKIVNNHKRLGGARNSYLVGNQYCKLGEVMVFLDGDDALIGRQVLSFLNAFYQRQKCALTYGKYIKVIRNSAIFEPSVPLPLDSIQQGAFRACQSFYTSHPKTMYVDVFQSIPQSYFHYHNGSWFDSAFDVVIMTPAVQLVRQWSRQVQQYLYEYRYGTGNNERPADHKKMVRYIYQKPALPKLSDFSFAQNPKTKNMMID